MDDYNNQELAKTLFGLKEDCGVMAEQIKTLQIDSEKHDEVHRIVLDNQNRQERALNQLLSASSGRERYEQGLKHGIAGLWIFLVAAASALMAWLGKNS